MDINDVKAGDWELVADQWDEVTSKPGQPLDYTRHYAGDVVTLNQADARRLFKGGAIVKPGSREKALAEAALAQAVALLGSLPDDMRTALIVDHLQLDPAAVAEQHTPAVAELQRQLDEAREQLAGQSGITSPAGDGGGGVSRPAKTAPIELWREFATETATTEEEKAAIATMDRKDLIAKYGA